ncbi:hypothetical protein [Demequina sp. SO4-18]|uniref:hypothetical protein n=1 Tax=Demequina sp. SO4-18 TaxID=3401026 RepID=UPI003B5C6339
MALTEQAFPRATDKHEAGMSRARTARAAAKAVAIAGLTVVGTLLLQGGTDGRSGTPSMGVTTIVTVICAPVFAIAAFVRMASRSAKDVEEAQRRPYWQRVASLTAIWGVLALIVGLPVGIWAVLASTSLDLDLIGSLAMPFLVVGPMLVFGSASSAVVEWFAQQRRSL